jgi:hypothetical protein
VRDRLAQHPLLLALLGDLDHDDAGADHLTTGVLTG